MSNAELLAAIKAQINDFAMDLAGKINHLADRFSAVEDRVDQHHRRITILESQVKSMQHTPNGRARK